MPQLLQVSVRFLAPPRDIVVADAAAPLPPLPRPAAPPPPSAPVPDPREAQHRAFAAALSGLQAAAARCEVRYEAMLAEMRRAAVELGIAVAGRLVLDRAEAGSFPIEAVVRSVVARLPRKSTVEVHLHPDDLAALHDRLGDGASKMVGQSVLFHADPAAARGGCRAVAGGVTVLSDLALQLADLRQHLLEGLP